MRQAIAYLLLAMAVLLIADFASYWMHRLMHEQVLWHAHAWHHSPTYLYWLAGARTTLIHSFMMQSLPALLAWVLVPAPQTKAIVVGILVLNVLNDLAVHSHLRLPFSRQLEYLVVTPRYHFVHHSTDRRFSDSNFGSILTIWDRMFGTYTNPELMEEGHTVGLNYSVPRWRLLLGIPPQRK